MTLVNTLLLLFCFAGTLFAHETHHKNQLVLDSTQNLKVINYLARPSSLTSHA